MPSYESVSKDVRKLIGRRLQVRYLDDDLPHEEELMKRVLAMRLALFSDLIGTSPSAREKVSHLRRTIFAIRVLDVGPYASDWATIKEWYLQSLCAGYAQEDWLRAFKQHVHGRIHNKWIRNSVLDLMEEDVGEAAIIQWLVFDEKLNLRTLDLTEQMVSDYRHAEESMTKWEYPEHSTLRQVAEEWFSDFCLQSYPFRPRHGNGATAEIPRRRSIAEIKNELLTYDERLLAWVRRRDISNIDPTYWFFAGEGTVNRITRLQCVPKSMTKNRTISAEPTCLQYLQQDLFRAMDEFFASSDLAAHVNMHDQARSAEACLAASESGQMASIDLSAASDSVTLPLLQYLLSGTGAEDLLLGLEATRSTHCLLPDGTVIPLTKYGGMGNGTTFPVETLVFAMLCEAAIRDASGCRRSMWKYYVYGDDILIDIRAVPQLLQLLESYHFVVNTTKSYWTTTGRIFREACGMWAIDGRDVTPLRLSRRLWWDDGSSPSEAVGWIALMNASLAYGLLGLRRTINAFLAPLDWFPHVPRVAISDAVHGTDSCSIVTFDDTATNYQCRQRAAWRGARCPASDRSGGYQTLQIRAKVARARLSPVEVSDESRLFSWEISTLQRSDNQMIYLDPEPVVPAASTLKWVERWVPHR